MIDKTDQKNLPTHLLDHFYPNTDGARYRRERLGKQLDEYVPEKDVRSRREAIDPKTGSPKKGIRFRNAHGNIVVKF